MFPCLSDNYGFVLHTPPSSILLCDCPDAGRYKAVIEHVMRTEAGPPLRPGKAKVTLLTTHHHADHTQGNGELLEAYPDAIVFSPSAAIEGTTHPLSAPSLPPTLTSPNHPSIPIAPIDTSGHTLPHVSYHLPSLGLLFAGDALFSLGCGRLFEGSPAQAHGGLSRLRDLPEATLLLCAHEYTAANVKFCDALGDLRGRLPAFRERAAEVERLSGEGRPTIPARLSAEREANPFLRWDCAAVREGAGVEEGAEDVDVYARIRELKDRF